MAILITGAGLIGCQVAQMLVQRGERPVLFDLAPQMDNVARIVDPGKIKIVRGDITEPLDLISVIEKEKIDRVIHTAAVMLAEIAERPADGIRVNITGTVNILEAARIMGLKRVVFTSSGVVCFGSVPFMDTESFIEDFPTRSLSGRPPQIYFTTKIACEYLGLNYVDIYNLDFVVVLDLFMTPTAMAFGDIILPVASALERDTIRAESWGNAWWGPIRAINKIVQVGDCRSDEQIILEVGKRLNPEAFPWNNVEEMLDFMLRPCGLTFSELREKGIPEYYPFEYKKYEKGLLIGDGQPGFATSTGKFMLYAPAFEKLGVDPLPYYEEPPQSPITSPEAKDYPLVLLRDIEPGGYFIQNTDKSMSCVKSSSTRKLKYILKRPKNMVFRTVIGSGLSHQGEESGKRRDCSPAS